MAKGIRTVSTVVTSCDMPAPGVRRLILADPDGWDLPPFRPGAHIDLHLAKGLVRTYSLCNEPSDNARYVVAVKLETESRGGSRFVHERLAVGTPVGVSLPRGGIEVSRVGRNVFLAGGIGVTPFLSVIRDMEAARRTNYELHWTSRGEPPLAEAIRPAIEAGRIRVYDTRREPRPDIATILHEGDNNLRAFCCGPDAMLDAFDAATASWPEARKHLERFTAPKIAANSDFAPYELVLAASKLSITVTPELGLLGALEALDADVPVSCAGGICGACRTRWIEGSPVHRDRVLTPAERASEVIVCVAECASSRLVLDL
jgi:vanillate O-demethylase ferredoxin subunit